MLKESVLYLVAFFLVIVLVSLFFRKRGKAKLKYQKVKNIFTNSEREFFYVLKEVVPPSYYIFAKVRMADVLLPQNIKDKGRWRGAFNKVACKHFDYVICDKHLNIVCAIELDDASHNRKDRVQRDIFVNSAAKDAKLRLLRIPLQKSYNKERLKSMLKL